MTTFSLSRPTLRQISCQGPKVKVVPKPDAWCLNVTAAGYSAPFMGSHGVMRITNLTRQAMRRMTERG